MMLFMASTSNVLFGGPCQVDGFRELLKPVGTQEQTLALQQAPDP